MQCNWYGRFAQMPEKMWRRLKPLTESDLIGRFREALVQYQAGPLGNYLPYTSNTERYLAELAALEPKTLATMHGSSYVGNGGKALLDLVPVMKEVLVP